MKSAFIIIGILMAIIAVWLASDYVNGMDEMQHACSGHHLWEYWLNRAK